MREVKAILLSLAIAALAIPPAACLPGKHQDTGCGGCCSGGVCPLPSASQGKPGEFPQTPPPKAEAPK